MHITSLVLPTTVCIALVGAYIGGHYMGESDGREADAGALFNLDASRSAEAFQMVTNVRQALRQSKPDQADMVLVRYAALKAPSLSACAASPECAAEVGPLMPTKAQLEEALAAERAYRARQ